MADQQARLRAYGVALAAGIGLLAGAAAAQPAPRLTPQAAIDDYCAAWSVTDRPARDRMLARVWAADGVYSDPSPTLATGRAALSETISEFQHQFPGSHFRCSAPQAHHNFMQVTWVLVAADGKPVSHGVDFYDMARDGRIQRIVGFFGDRPAIAP